MENADTKSELYISKIISSISAIDFAIQNTKATITAFENDNVEIFARIEKYEQIVCKQRKIAREIQSHLKLQNWSEVHRRVHIIHHLSQFLRDDLQTLMYEAQGAKVIHVSNQMT